MTLTDRIQKNLDVDRSLAEDIATEVTAWLADTNVTLFLVALEEVASGTQVSDQDVHDLQVAMETINFLADAASDR